MAARREQDAIQILTDDHRRVEQLFGEFENAGDDATKEEFARRICTELKVHSMLEEEILYPALRRKIEDADLDEALVEHDGAKLLINEIEAGSAADSFFEAKVKVLKEQIEHHIEEEESDKNNLFAQARATNIDLNALADRMVARKAELMQLAGTEGLPPATTATMETV